VERFGDANELTHHMHVVHSYRVDSGRHAGRNRRGRPAEPIIGRRRLAAPVRRKLSNERFPRRPHKYTVSGLSETPKRT
jgi:hypothetical protein